MQNPLAWWKVHESQFSYVVFVAFLVEGERVFNIADICTNMRWSIWGIQNLEILVNIYKKWIDDVWACTMSMEDFIEMEGMLMKENEDDRGYIGLLEVDDNIFKTLGFFYIVCTYDEEVVVSSC